MAQGPGAKHLHKKAKRGFRGYPVATIIYYGQDDKRASKVAVGIIHGPEQEPRELERWYSTDRDARQDMQICEAIAGFIQQHGTKSVVLSDRIVGCPHEEGIDYEGPTCPMCPFWAGRDRFSGRILS
jgi:hypothetical protein